MTVNEETANGTLKMLSESENLSDITFLLAHENEIKPTPINGPIVAVSVKKCNIGDKLKKVIDSGEIVTTESRYADVTLSVDIYLPYSMGGVSGHKIFDRIATCLIFEKKANISEAYCGDSDYDKAAQAIVLRSTFTYRITVNN